MVVVLVLVVVVVLVLLVVPVVSVAAVFQGAAFSAVGGRIVTGSTAGGGIVKIFIKML